ncbi:P-loop ATPase, Sll1717 family [Streptomyces pseudovenezuelae]|uniref:P-loop ATPase, Sll1717 family n=1 Tax=Streptomyces pseudovenezuelae TaxID=67350 RepID=UPI0036EE4D97
MSERSVIERLYFGRDDAERDMADGLLRSGFQETAAYNAVASGRKTLVIGRKGAGKSAICVRLASERDGSRRAELITAADIAGEELRAFELTGRSGDQAKSLLWRYVFAVRAAQYLVGHAEQHEGRSSEAVKALKAFIKANRELFGDPRTAGGFGRWLQGLSGSLSLEAFGVKATADFAQQTVSAEEGPGPAQRLQILENGVDLGFKELGCAPEHTLVLLVDQLEQLWSADLESHSLVIGLLLATWYVGSQYRGALRCVVFLRSDIYDSLLFQEGDKFRSDELRIDWSESDLEALVLRRARASVGPGLTAERLWAGVFPRTVNGLPGPEYLLSHALPRPRDLIQYLNECQYTAIGNGHRDRIHESDIRLATHRFSQWKLKDLVQEYLVAHPFLERLIPLFQNSGYLVTRAALGNRFRLVEDALHREFPAYTQALTPDGIINTLHEVGFLGVRRGNGIVYSDSLRLPVQPYEDEFHLHPCFRAALGATAPAGFDVYGCQVNGSIVTQVVAGDVHSLDHGATRASREHRLLERLARACRSILGGLAHARTVPDEVREEISVQVRRVLGDAERGLSTERPMDEERTVLEAASYFHSIATRLRRDGLEGDTGADSLAMNLTAQSTRLVRAVGGGTGSSGEA